MTTAIIRNFEKMIADGKDSTLPRFSLGNEYLKAGDPVSASKLTGTSNTSCPSGHSNRETLRSV